MANNTDNGKNFDWDKLLLHIKRGNVIPVIGRGLLEVETGAAAPEPLYATLAKKIAAACKLPPENINIDNKNYNAHHFPAAAQRYLLENDNNYIKLSYELEEAMKGLRTAPRNPLQKLARVKNFRIFITTAYDDQLTRILRQERGDAVHVHYYTQNERNFDQLDAAPAADREDKQNSLVFHQFGSMTDSLQPAYTERDILETLVKFQEDFAAYPHNKLFQKLQNSSFLFIGCGYDDWLFRFYIRILGNRPYGTDTATFSRFVGDDFGRRPKDPHQDLPRFLRQHDAEVFYTRGGGDFVDRLWEKLETKLPGVLYREDEGHGKVFISFEGRDREAAAQLAANLRQDGFDVWYDEDRLKGGQDVDERIVKAIDRSRVFLPVMSRHSRDRTTGTGEIKYHIREWERAYTNLKAGEKKHTIIPVVIDGEAVGRQYRDFEKLVYVTVPGGRREGEYEKLKRSLEAELGINGGITGGITGERKQDEGGA